MTIVAEARADGANGSLRRALSFSAFGTAATRMVGAAGGVAVARALNPAERGDLAVLIVVASIGSLLGAAGLQFWIAREVARTDSMRGPDAVALLHAVAVVVIGAALAIVVAPSMVPHTVSVSAYAGTASYAVTGAVCLAVLALPNGLRCMGVVAGAVMVASVTYLAGALGLWATGTASVSGVLWFATLGNVGTLIVVVGFWWSRRAPTTHHRARNLMRDWHDGLRFGVAGGAGELVLFAMFRIDFLLVAAFLPLSDVGLYAVATALTELLWIVPDGVAQVLLPTGARTDDTEVFAPIFRLSMGVTVIAAAGVALLAGPCIEFVFGPSYASASTVVPLLAVAAVAGGAWKMVAADVVARASTGSRLTSALAGLAVMVALDLILIPGFGIRGAGFAAAVGYCAAFMVIGRSWKQTTGNRLRELIRLHPDDLRVVRNDGAIDPKRSLAT